jgi:hypothetical protein
VAVLGLLEGPRHTHADGEGTAISDLRRGMARGGKREGMWLGKGRDIVLKKAEGASTINVGARARMLVMAKQEASARRRRGRPFMVAHMLKRSCRR